MLYGHWVAQKLSNKIKNLHTLDKYQNNKNFIFITVSLDYFLGYLFFFFFFCWTFCLSRLTSLQFILYQLAGFHKPTISQSPPTHLQDYSICNNARLEFSTIFVPSFDPIEWCLKNGLHSGGLNPGPLGHESSALTTRQRLLAWVLILITCS
jgi:hypothetical protein